MKSVYSLLQSIVQTIVISDFSLQTTSYLALMYDVIIIGAGFAGLTAARTILKTASNARVLVLEVGSSAQGISQGD